MDNIELRVIFFVLGILLIFLDGMFAARLTVKRQTTLRGELMVFAKVFGLGTMLLVGLGCLAAMWIGVQVAVPLRVTTIVPLLLGEYHGSVTPTALSLITTAIAAPGLGFTIMGLTIINHKDAWPVVAITTGFGLLIMFFAPDIGAYLLAHVRVP